MALTSAGTADPTAEVLRGSQVLVTGGTGFTGRCLVQKLLDRGAKVRCVVRKDSPGGGALPPAVQRFIGDVYDANVIARAADGVQYVFHLATRYRDGSADANEHWRVHVQSTQHLAEAAMRGSSLRRFVHVSTIGVHGHISAPPASEEAPYDPGDVYQATKLEGELWIRAFATRTGMPLTVIRPAAIMGPGDRRLLKVFRFATVGVCPLIDGHDTLYHLIHVDDLTECMLVSAAEERALGQVFICGNSSSTSLVAIVGQVAKMLGRKVRYVNLPGRPLFMLARLNERLARAIGVRPMLYERRIAFFTKDRAFDTRKVQDVLGYRFIHTNETGIADTVRGYVAAGWM